MLVYIDILKLKSKGFKNYNFKNYKYEVPIAGAQVHFPFFFVFLFMLRYLIFLAFFN